MASPPGERRLRPLGCIDEETARIRFEPGSGELQWDVDLDPGGYQLDVFARFEASDGRTGDVSGVLGLTVAGPKETTPWASTASRARCWCAGSPAKVAGETMSERLDFWAAGGRLVVEPRSTSWLPSSLAC